MVESTVSHKLAAILAADVVGYSRLMEHDERATLNTLDACRLIFREQTDAQQGRVIDTAGDSVLAAFETATGALRAALAIQAALAEQNGLLEEERRMAFRIGINLGEVIEKPDGTVYGGGVNVAARLESLADPGGITISRTVFDQVKNRVDVDFDFIGEQDVKNILEPVPAYRVRLAGAPARRPQRGPRKGRRLGLIAGGVAAAAILVVAGIWVDPGSQGPDRDGDDVGADLLAVPNGPAIAVLPFKNLSGDAEQDYFADGITEQLMTDLSRFRELLVIARSSSSAYKGVAKDVREIAADLGADYVVEGSVHRSGDEVRVSAQLIDGASGSQVWSETYDRTFDNIFALQDDITAHISGAIAGIQGALTIARRDDSRRTANPQAYDLVLRSTEYDRVLSTDALFAARRHLEKAIEIEPDYGLARALLGQNYVEEYVNHSIDPGPEMLKRAEKELKLAIELSPNNATARYTYARYLFHTGQVFEFLTESKEALKRNPNDSANLAGLAIFYGNLGEDEMGMAFAEKAIEITPNHPSWYYFPIGHIHFYNKRFEQALEAYRKVNLPGFFWYHANMAATLGHMGRDEEAKEHAKALLEAYPGFDEVARFEVFEKWQIIPSHAEVFFEGLRKAGLYIPDESLVTH